MRLPDLGPADSWEAAFLTVRAMFLQGRLTAVAVVSESKHTEGSYAPVDLLQAAAVGFAEKVLNNFESTCRILKPGAKGLRLAYGPLRSVQPGAKADGWLLAIVYS